MDASVVAASAAGRRAARAFEPRWRRTLAIAGCIGALSCDGPEPARYARAEFLGRPIRWAEPKLVLRVFPPPPESGLDQNALVRGLRRAAELWIDERCSALKIDIRLATGQPRGERDGINAVVVHSKQWCPVGASLESECYEPRLHAFTRLYKAPPEPGQEEARLLEADVEINAVNFRWSAAAEDRRTHGTLHLGAMLVHELGHVFGLQHGCRHPGPVPSSKALLPQCGDTRLVMVPDPQRSGRPLALEPLAAERRAMCEVYRKDRRGSGSFAGLLALATATALGALYWFWRRGHPLSNE